MFVGGFGAYVDVDVCQFAVCGCCVCILALLPTLCLLLVERHLVDENKRSLARVHDVSRLD